MLTSQDVKRLVRGGQMDMIELYFGNTKIIL